MQDVTGYCQGRVGYSHVQVIRKDFTLPSFFDGSAVLLERIFAKRLPRAGSRCCTNTYAMPVLAGMPARSAENDSSPPAEAPMPTIGKDIAFPLGFRVPRSPPKASQK